MHSDEEVSHSLDRIIYEAIQLDDIKEVKFRKKRKDDSGDSRSEAEVKAETQPEPTASNGDSSASAN